MAGMPGNGSSGWTWTLSWWKRVVLGGFCETPAACGATCTVRFLLPAAETRAAEQGTGVGHLHMAHTHWEKSVVGKDCRRGGHAPTLTHTLGDVLVPSAVSWGQDSPVMGTADIANRMSCYSSWEQTSLPTCPVGHCLASPPPDVCAWSTPCFVLVDCFFSHVTY